MNPTNSPIPPMRKMDKEKSFWHDCPICFDNSFSEPEFLTCCEMTIHRSCWEGIRDLRNGNVEEGGINFNPSSE